MANQPSKLAVRKDLGVLDPFRRHPAVAALAKLPERFPDPVNRPRELRPSIQNLRSLAVVDFPMLQRLNVIFVLSQMPPKRLD